MSDIQRTIEAMQEWERCPDGTVMHIGPHQRANFVKGGGNSPFSWRPDDKYTFEYPDGWRKHEGDECPVDGDTRIMVMYCDMRRGYTPIVSAENVSWHRVIYYRIIEDESQHREEAKPNKVKPVWHKDSLGTYWFSEEGSPDCKRRDLTEFYTRVEVDLSGDSE